MERLTEKDQYSQDYKIQAKNLNSHCVAIDAKGYMTYYGQHIDKLAEYENLEEQGRLIKVPVKDGATAHRECVHIKSTCYHENYKCSECPLTELFCDEFYKAIDRCYEEAYASGCLAGIELWKSEAEAKLKELRGGENER